MALEMHTWRVRRCLPDFPVVNGGSLGSPPTGESDQRSFITKFDPTGVLGNGNRRERHRAGPFGVHLCGRHRATARLSDHAGRVSDDVSGLRNLLRRHCLAQIKAANQYVTKVDPTGSKLINSTAVGVPGGGNTTNSGLAVDAAGAVYLTEFTVAKYPFFHSPSGDSNTSIFN
jgi:hypothetical protein